MPQLSDLVKQRNDKKFIKKSYRPWDLSGTGASHQQEANHVTHETINQEPKNIEALSMDGHNLSNEDLDITKSDNITGNDIGNVQVTNEEQTDNIQVTVKKQSDNNQLTNRQHIDNDLNNTIDNAENIVFLADSIRKLTGIQKQIFFYVIDLCSSRGLLDSGVILTNDLTTIANCSFGSVKTSLSRLINKKLILRKKGKAARGGHIILGITKEIQAAALHAQRFRVNPLMKMSHTDNIIDNNLGNNSSYSSSIYINNNTTKLPPEWDEIDISSLSTIGFSKTQLLQLYTRELNTPEIIQESINHFSFALKNNKKVTAYSDPLNVLMGVLRKGMNWHEKDYISPKEKALTELLAFKKMEADRINQLEKNIVDEEFKLWRVTLDSIQKESILSSKPKSNFVSKAIAEKVDEGYLLQYFKENIHKQIS